jgi:NTP pyrophosphatase (non-canonical NTP hydrolase)
MTVDEYAAWAATLGSEPLSANKEMLAYLGLGLTGEAGEVADRLKKFLRDGAWDAEGLAEELGDVVYFWACLCLVAGKQPSQVLAASRHKIETRAAVSRTSERSERRSGNPGDSRVPDK